MATNIFLIVLSVVLLIVGICLVYKNIDNIKTANKGIRDCKNTYKHCQNEIFLRLESNWKELRKNDYIMLMVNSLIVIINLLNAIRLIAQMV